MRSIAAICVVIAITPAACADAPDLKLLADDFERSVRPFLVEYCLGCHGEAKSEAKLNLSAFRSIDAVRADLGHWELVLLRLKAGEMPPDDAPKTPSATQRAAIVTWIEDLRTSEANRNAGDPGIVLPRRLNNTEYDFTIRDLTGADIRPTREFPVDPANTSGFANSGESLSMSPALFAKYLTAARQVADHLVLSPTGFTFSPHPAVVYSDRDKFAVHRVMDFYLAQKTDYADFLVAAWHFKHRDALGKPEMTLDAAAAAQGVSRKYLATLWEILHDGNNAHGLIAKLREQWEALPAPENTSTAPPIEPCRAIRDWIVAERKSRQFKFPAVMIEELNPTTQPGVLWKNRLMAEHRRKGKLSDQEQQDDKLRPAIERFCDVFPDTFMVTERGRSNLPLDEQDKGRLLGAGFHLQVGYYRDDAPLCDLLLTDKQKAQLDQLWHELYFVTDVSVRQFQDYIYFERAEGREIITEAEFDFARGEDRAVASGETMKKFADLYVAAVRKRGLSEEAVAEISRYFVEMSQQIRVCEQVQAEAEPKHLQALVVFAAKAWRRPLTSDESRELISFYRDLREREQLRHEDAMRDAVVSILVSPRFCYRADAGEQDNRLTNDALASRLSYFLWSSMPDEELLELARTKQLQGPEFLAAQSRRMLKHERSRALAIEFAGNWLDYRQFPHHVGVDRTMFPQFTDELRESMFQEPVRFVSDLILRDGSVHELLEARHTFVDKLLAQHYGIPFSSEAAGEDGWLRVENAREYGRGGLLPMAVFLTKSSPGLRTSPVKRGYWVVRQLLGESIPAPPADVPELPMDEAGLGDFTLRQLLEKHREVKSCADCHARFDFAGLVFEGYGPIGERRTHDLGSKPVDDSTEFPGGSAGRGLEALQAYLLQQRTKQFHENLCRKLLAYGLGRSLLLSDERTITEMKQALAANDGRFGSLVEVVVTSPQFRNKRPASMTEQASPP